MLKKHWDKVILALITVAAFFIRTFHFREWLFFSMDQARDAYVGMHAFFEGAAALPLLGPRAAGTYLRLGPVFYYFQYAATKIFGSIDPPVFAYPDLFFSILTIPLLYFFLRLYFSKFVSLLSTSIFAFSFLIIQYSRFAWNPNSVPFWVLVCFYGLVRFSEEEGRKKYGWIALLALGLAVASQLHFLVFLALPAIVLFYLFLTKGFSKAGWKGIGLAILIILVFYTPMILSEISTSGDNISQFIFAFSKKPQSYSLRSSFLQNIFMHGKYYFLFLSSYTSRSFFPSMIAGLVLIAGGVISASMNYFKEKVGRKKNFLALVIAWSAIAFLILVPFSFDAQPRFFFLAVALPFVYFAFWASELLKLRKIRYLVFFFASGAAIFLMALNFEATAAWYGSLATNSEPKALRGRVLSIKQDDNLGFTFSQIEAVSGYLYDEWRNRGHRIYITGNMNYRAPIQYMLEKNNPPADFKTIGRKKQDRSVSYFSIMLTKQKGRFVPKNLVNKFDVIGSKVFGALTVHELKLKDVQPEIKKKSKPVSEPETESEKPEARKKERVFWQDIFE